MIDYLFIANRPQKLGLVAALRLIVERLTCGFLATLILILCLISGIARGADTAPLLLANHLDILIDLDHTLVEMVESEYGNEALTAFPNYFSIGPDIYRQVLGAPEFIAALTTIPNARISFYSGGPESRNLKILEAIKLPLWSNGKRLTVLDIKHKLLSETELVDVSKPGNENLQSSVPELYGLVKKDAKKIGADVNLNNLVFFDDNGTYVARGQERNWIKVYRTARFDQEMSEVIDSLVGTPRMHEELLLEVRARNKLIRALGIFFQSYYTSKATSKTVADALAALQWDGQKYDDARTNTKHLYNVGLERMQKFNPEMNIIKAELPCEHALSELVGTKITPWDL